VQRCAYSRRRHTLNFRWSIDIIGRYGRNICQDAWLPSNRATALYPAQGLTSELYWAHERELQDCANDMELEEAIARCALTAIFSLFSKTCGALIFLVDAAVVCN
jgi:hypothetical protein